MLDRIGVIIGWFGAAFLVYVVAGGLLGLVIASPFALGERACWPMFTFGLSIMVPCDDAAAQALWFGAVGIPNMLVWTAALEFVGLAERIAPSWFESDTYLVLDNAAVAASNSTLALLGAIGFAHVFMRSRIAACGLALALASLILFVAFAPWVARWTGP